MHFVRRIALAFALVLAGLVPAFAGPLLVVDRSTLEVLYAEDAGQPWHPASLTKLMTAYVAFEEIAKGNVTLDTPVTISRKAFNLAPSKSGLPVDGAISLRDALYILIVKSANDVALAIAETIGGDEETFVAMMNDVSLRMGLSASHFVNSHGLHNPAQVTSARDVAVLALYIEQSFPQYMPMFSTGVVRLGKARLESQNALLKGFSGATGMKTGFVCASGLNLVATVDRDGRKLLAVVLGGASSRDRNERTAELFVKALSGSMPGTGRNVLSLTNAAGAAPVDMRAQICGKESTAYAKAMEAEFPMGLKGQPSYLTEKIALSEYQAVDLGQIRTGIALPRPRPYHEPVFSVPEPQQSASLDATLRPGIGASATPHIPYPRPRPEFAP